LSKGPQFGPFGLDQESVVEKILRHCPRPPLMVRHARDYCRRKPWQACPMREQCGEARVAGQRKQPSLRLRHPERALSHELIFGHVISGPSLPTTISAWPMFPPETSKNSLS